MKIERANPTSLCGFGSNVHRVTHNGDTICHVAVRDHDLFLHFVSCVSMENAKAAIDLVERHRNALLRPSMKVVT